VELGHRAALQGDVPIMEQLVETIRRLHKAALPMARSIAEARPPPRHVPVGVRDRVLKQLRDAGVVERGSHGHWKIINPLFREYLVQFDPI
jgi:hypothetical protein